VSTSPSSYRDQTVLVTGASSGIGAAFAEGFAARGADLVLVARRRDRLEDLADRLRATYPRSRVTPIAFDLGADDAGGRLRDAVEERGLTVTGVVNNAGMGSWARFAEEDPARLRRMMRLNMDAVVDISHAFLPALRAARAGFLLNVTSVAAYSSIPMQGVYSATKAFVLSFTEALWAETRGSGVRVLAFAPGVTETEFFDVVGTRDADGGARAQTPAQVVRAALAVLDSDNPPPSAVSGARNHLLTLAPRLLSRRAAVTATGRSTMRSSTASA
jgi:uncharacterized protein